MVDKLQIRLSKIGGTPFGVRRMLIRHDRKDILRHLGRIEFRTDIRYKFSYLQECLERKNRQWVAPKTVIVI